MNHRLITIILCIFFSIGATVLGADGLELYENVEKGFSLSYPKEWEKKEYEDKLELYSSMEFASDYEGGGVMFGVYYYTISESVTPEQAIRELLDVGDDFTLEAFTQKKLAGQSWAYTQSTNKEQDIKAEFYVFSKVNTVFIIACGYKPIKVSAQFTSAVNAILNSFQFITEESGSQGALKQYENKKLGVSFSYPSAWKLEEYGNNVTVASNSDFLDQEGKGAGFALFYGTFENFNLSETPKTVEELWEKLKEEEGGFKEITKTYVDWLGSKWLFVEFLSTNENLKAYFYLRLDGEKIFMVGYIYHPPETENAYKTTINEIHTSIRFFPPVTE